LAAAVQTIKQIGEVSAGDEAIADAFDGAAVAFRAHDGSFEWEVKPRGLLAP
jgi:hypothetical protein